MHVYIQMLSGQCLLDVAGLQKTLQGFSLCGLCTGVSSLLGLSPSLFA